MKILFWWSKVTLMRFSCFFYLSLVNCMIMNVECLIFILSNADLLSLLNYPTIYSFSKSVNSHTSGLRGIVKWLCYFYCFFNSKLNKFQCICLHQLSNLIMATESIFLGYLTSYMKCNKIQKFLLIVINYGYKTDATH